MVWTTKQCREKQNKEKGNISIAMVDQRGMFSG